MVVGGDWTRNDAKHHDEERLEIRAGSLGLPSDLRMDDSRKAALLLYGRAPISKPRTGFKSTTNIPLADFICYHRRKI